MAGDTGLKIHGASDLTLTNAPNLPASGLNNGTTGTGAIVLATSPTLITPALGTPASGALTNCTSIPVAQATGLLPEANGGTGISLIPSFAAYNNAATTLTAASWTKVKMDTKEFDHGTYYDAATNYRYTPGKAGTYSISAEVWTNSTNVNATTQYTLGLYKNGSVIKYSTLCPGMTGTGTGQSCTILVVMNGSTDYLEVFFYNGNGALNLTTNNSSLVTFWSGTWISP